MIKRANTIKCHYKVENDKYFLFFNIDNNIKSYFSVLFPFDISAFDMEFYDYLGSSIVVVLASMILVKKIKAEFNFQYKKEFLDIIKILYDIRCYSEGIDFIKLPQIISPSKSVSNKFCTNSKNTILFWSGGIDSTYSHILLNQNNYNIISIHSNINIDFKTSELTAVKHLSEQLNIKPSFIKIDFPYLKKIGKKYSNKFDEFPSYNSIPFGRDLVHVFSGLFFAKKYCAKYLCFGNEYELWNNYIYKDNRKICRNDLQSELGAVYLNELIKKINSNLQIFSPIASLSKFKIYSVLFEKYNKILQNTTSCYFGKACGECSNCFLYKVSDNLMMQKSGSIYEFKKIILNSKNITEEETFANVYHLYFYDIIHSNTEFKKNIDVIFAKLLNKNKKEIKKDLLTIQEVKFLPDNFKFYE